MDPSPPTSGNTAINWKNFTMIAAQLGLITVLIHLFEIKDRSFWNVFWIVLAGFSLHSFLPARMRLPFFVVLSLAAFALVFRMDSLWLIGAGIGILGICHLKIHFRFRVAMIVSLGIALAVIRMGKLSSPFSTQVVTFLASIFMFRVILYLYDLKHDKKPATFAEGLSYFFLLPNACFAFFPVIDSRAFRKNYYNEPASEIYQSGIDWMFKGITHLIFYRILYHHFTLSPANVADAGQFLQYVIVSFLLYVQVSGQFHLIVGILHLFGFNLPKTHYLYFLVPNFAEVWRCLNIYWKDFMMKIFYYPAYFRLRKQGTRRALILSTIYVFTITCLLHSYQWFWMLGDFPLKAQDFLFWGILGGLVLWNVWKESGEKKTAVEDKSANLFLLSTKIAFTFLSLSVLWSLWNSQSIPEWLGIVSAAKNQWWKIAVFIPLFILTIAVVISILRFMGIPLSVQAADQWLKKKGHVAGTRTWFHQPALGTTIGSILLISIALPQLQNLAGPETASFLASLKKERLNQQDTALLTRGYYEQLIGVERMNLPLVDLLIQEPQDVDEEQDLEKPEEYQLRLQAFYDKYKDARITDLDCLPDAAFNRDFQASFRKQRILLSIAHPTNDFLLRDAYPNAKYCSDGHAINLNSAGMRDREYSLKRPPGTYRIVILGSSHVFGAGLSEPQIFPAILEDLFNKNARNSSVEKYEILNLSLLARSPFQHLMLLDRTAFQYQPNIVLVIGMGDDIDRSMDHLMGTIKRRIEPPYDFIKQLIRDSGVTTQTKLTDARGKLEPYGKEMVEWIYQQIVKECREKQVAPVWTFLPRVKEEEPFQSFLSDAAKKAGFVVLNISDVYHGYDPDALVLRKSDTHPNSLGHQLIAQRIYSELIKQQQMAKLSQ